MKLKDLSQLPPKILLYGAAGSGKTALTLTLGEQLQIADLDDGLRSGVSIKDDFTNSRLAVDVVQFKEPEPHKRAVAFAQYKAHTLDVANKCRIGKYPFKAYATDSLTTLADYALNYVMANSGMLGQTPQIQHWGMAFNEIGNILGVIRSLPIIVILIAHEQLRSLEVETTETSGGQSKTVIKRRDDIEIAIPGRNLPSKITRYFDEVLYMRPRQAGGGKVRYTVQTLSDGLVTARSRSCLPNNLDTSIGLWKIIEQMGYTV